MCYSLVKLTKVFNLDKLLVNSHISAYNLKDTIDEWSTVIAGSF